MKNISFAQAPKRTDSEEYDLVILVAGTGSTIAAWTLAVERQRVAIIDRKYIGGSCSNIACLPKEHHPQREGRVLCSPKEGVWPQSPRGHCGPAISSESLWRAQSGRCHCRGTELASRGPDFGFMTPSVTISKAGVSAGNRKTVDVRILRLDSKPVMKTFLSGTDLKARIFGGDNVG